MPTSVLFLCTGNSARSILAEAYLNHAGRGRFEAHSAGSQPTGKVNPFAVEVLREHGIAPAAPRSKNWNEFAGAGARPIDLIFTVCDNAAGEVCPVWPGRPISAHWGVPDPAAAAGDDGKKRDAFREAFDALKQRIDRLIALPVEQMSAAELKSRLDEIGRG